VTDASAHRLDVERHAFRYPTITRRRGHVERLGREEPAGDNLAELWIMKGDVRPPPVGHCDAVRPRAVLALDVVRDANASGRRPGGEAGQRKVVRETKVD
jgi:hypothetical protein